VFFRFSLGYFDLVLLALLCLGLVYFIQ